jgi:hypothetical protein
MAGFEETFLRVTSGLMIMLPLAVMLWGVLWLISRVVTGPPAQPKYPRGSFPKACGMMSIALLIGYGVGCACSPAVAEAAAGYPTPSAGAIFLGFCAFLASLTLLLRVALPSSLGHSLVVTVGFFACLIALAILFPFAFWLTR